MEPPPPPSNLPVGLGRCHGFAWVSGGHTSERGDSPAFEALLQQAARAGPRSFDEPRAAPAARDRRPPALWHAIHGTRSRAGPPPTLLAGLGPGPRRCALGAQLGFPSARANRSRQALPGTAELPATSAAHTGRPRAPPRWWSDPDLNRGPQHFQCCALPTELSDRRRGADCVRRSAGRQRLTAPRKGVLAATWAGPGGVVWAARLLAAHSRSHSAPVSRPAPPCDPRKPQSSLRLRLRFRRPLARKGGSLTLEAPCQQAARAPRAGLSERR
jgi:hypothetical protein